MTSDNWTLAQQLLMAWPESPGIAVAGTCRRLQDALRGLSGGEASSLDVACLVRQALLEHAARSGVMTPILVPSKEGLPSVDEWSKVGCSVLAQPQGLRVSPTPWHPPLGEGEDDQVVVDDLEAIYRGTMLEPARPLEVPADPFWEETVGFDKFRSVGQRQAARSVALAPPGTFAIVCLPTGTGKTAVVQAAAMLRGVDDGVCIVVVPTVVLALDMERRMRDVLRSRSGRRELPPRFAYIGGMSPEEKQQVRDNVAAGRQSFVFTSPEALVTGLSGAALAASQAGHLRFLVLDEAHLVEQWGNEFRPEFQTLAGLRTTLLAAAPAGRELVTVAMSATLNETHLKGLSRLFGDGTEVGVTWASALRAEPSFYQSRFSTAAERQSAVVEAILRLPRPLVLYASKREDVKSWVATLRQAGLQRLASVTGDSSDEDRRRAVEGWRGVDTSGGLTATSHDIVVATSAFGLGVDMADVRSIVHACVPETIDRFYQEVGRGGRDGKPCLSYLAHEPGDLPTARGLNRTTVISADRGWQRWQRMQYQASTSRNGDLEVDLDSRPVDMQEGFGTNRQWNVRTLNLMQSCNLIRLTTLRPPAQNMGETAESWLERLDQFYAVAGSRTGLRVSDGRVNDQEVWTAKIEIQRRRILAEQRQSLARMEDVLGGARCIGSIVAEHYRARWDGGLLTTARTCRGCPACRRSTLKTTNGFYALGEPPFPEVQAWSTHGSPIQDLTRSSPWLSIWWSNDEERRDLVPQLLERLARRGMSVVSGEGLTSKEARKLQRSCYPSAVIRDDDADLLRTYEGPLIVLMSDTDVLSPDLLARLQVHATTVLLHAADLASSEQPGERLRDRYSQSLSVAAVLGQL